MGLGNRQAHILTGTFRLIPTLSSFKGEYLAILLGLQVAHKQRWRSIVICSDSDDAVRAASAEVLAATSPVASYHPALQYLKSKFASVTLQRIEGSANVAHPFSQVTGQTFHTALGHESLDALLAHQKEI
jgi:hypothetical protein